MIFFNKFFLQKFIVENEKQNYVLNERNLLRDLDSDFIMKLIHTGRDDKFVFFCFQCFKITFFNQQKLKQICCC